MNHCRLSQVVGKAVIETARRDLHRTGLGRVTVQHLQEQFIPGRRRLQGFSDKTTWEQMRQRLWSGLLRPWSASKANIPLGLYKDILDFFCQVFNFVGFLNEP